MHAIILELLKSLRNKATADFVPMGRIKRSERKNVQLCGYAFLHYFPSAIRGQRNI